MEGGLYEKLFAGGGFTHLHRIQVGGRTVAEVRRFTSAPEQVRWWHVDHLGSVEAISKEDGTLEARYSYDAWGKRRDPASLVTPPPGQWPILPPVFRGYTGHEHLDHVGFIHMNGRIYAAELGRFASPDPFVQFPSDSQGLNRYAYVANNPLSATDPSGFGIEEFLRPNGGGGWGPFLAIIGLYFDIMAYSEQGVLPGQRPEPNWLQYGRTQRSAAELAAESQGREEDRPRHTLIERWHTPMGERIGQDLLVASAAGTEFGAGVEGESGVSNGASQISERETEAKYGQAIEHVVHELVYVETRQTIVSVRPANRLLDAIGGAATAMRPGSFFIGKAKVELARKAWVQEVRYVDIVYKVGDMKLIDKKAATLAKGDPYTVYVPLACITNCAEWASLDTARALGWTRTIEDFDFGQYRDLDAANKMDRRLEGIQR